MHNLTIKNAGILDTPKDTLATDVWNSNQTLKPIAKKQILSSIKEVFPLDMVKGVYILGSITGFK